MARFFVRLSYKGTNFHGWQIQPNAVTVQETLEKVFSLILQEEIKIVGCGRTDTGVHASRFYAHFDCKSPLSDLEKLTYKLNSLLPKDIAIQEISKVKTPFRYEESYFYPFPLNISAMNEAAKKLLDYRDFTSFSKLHTDVKTNNCVIKKAYWEEADEQLIFTITADRFLRNMVRAIVGTLLEVGKGRCSVERFCEIIEAKDRGKAGSSTPAEGLFLHKITYPFL